MSVKSVEFHPEAAQEAQAATEWYLLKGPLRVPDSVCHPPPA